MIELNGHQLIFSFPEVNPKAKTGIGFQRTLRIPDDNQTYSLPPGLGTFPLSHVDDFASHLPRSWSQHGGVFLPMYQAEALWIDFEEGGNLGGYPCAIKVAAGKVDAISGEPWSLALSDAPQNYVVSDDQPWLDGFNVAEGMIRQFVAMPLGQGYTAEEQITEKADVGGIQLAVMPMKAEVYRDLFEEPNRVNEDLGLYELPCFLRKSEAPDEMGLAPGGLMRQEIYEDEYGIDVWDTTQVQRCFVHIANSEQYSQMTGQEIPVRPPTAKDYSDHGLPWFDYYSDHKPIQGSGLLSRLSSIAATRLGKGQGVFPDNESVQTKVVKVISK